MRITNTLSKNLALTLLVFAPQLFAMQGTLDTSFNPTGTPPGSVVTPIPGSSSSQINSIAIQSNGQIVAGGSARISSNPEFTLARYNTNGTLDTSFGSNGIVITAIGIGGSEIFSISIQSNGQIVAGGQANISGAQTFALARYNTNGSLDNSFGTNGVVTTQISGNTGGSISSIAIQANGQIVAGGYATIGGNHEFVLARYNTNGTLDTSFGTNGIVTTEIGSSDSNIYSVAIQSNGQIVAGGDANPGGNFEFALARYNTNGSLDTSFGTNGIVTTKIGSSDSIIHSIAIQANGQIVAGGGATIGSNDEFALARFNSNGSLDTSFGSNGTVTTPIGGSSIDIASISMQSDGKIVAVGYNIDFGSTPCALARYNTNGSLDTSFGTGGIVTTTNEPFGKMTSIAIQSNGQIVAGGVDSTGSNFALARYNASTSLTQSSLTLALKNKYYANGSGAKQGPVF